MLDTIPVPADSKFGAMVARRLNALRPIAPAGSLAMSGPTGTGFAAPPTNLRDRRGLSAPSPRQFTLRAEVETKQDEPEQKRLVVKMCDFCDDAVRWNHIKIPQGGTATELDSDGFREIYVGGWSESLSESKTFYLNLKIEFDVEGGWTTGHDFITTFSEWNVEDEPLEEKFEIGASMMFASFPIGHVLAGDAGAFVRQYFDGSQNFVDLSWWQDKGSGGGGDDPIANDKSCFRIASATPSEDGSAVELTIVDNYYMAAGILMRIEDASVVLTLSPAAEVTTPLVIYMSIDNYGLGTIETAAYDDEFKKSMKDESKYVVPLYLVNAADGNVITDLRNAPNVQVWDMTEDTEASS